MNDTTSRESDAFPELVQLKSSTAKIYRTRNRNRVRYEVRFHNPDGSLERDTFDSYDEPKKHANAVLKLLASGGGTFLPLRGKERFAYERAVELLAPTGLTLNVVVAQFLEVTTKLKGVATPREAADFTRTHHPKMMSSATVEQVVEEFIAAKRKEGLSHLYQRDLRTRLSRFTKYFKCQIAGVATPDLVRYLNSVGGGTRNRRNHITTIGTVMNFAKMMGHLPDGHPGISKIPKPRKGPRDIAIALPDEMRKLLACASPAVKMAVALGGFAGIRTQEIMRLEWRDIDFNQGHVEVTARSAKTGLRRLVPIADNLRAWIEPHRRRDGSVVGFKNLSNEFLKLAKKAGVEWKRNMLRHSAISYKVAAVKNLPQVALEAGNSVGIIQRDYLKVVTEERGKEWFSIFPSQPHNIVALPKSEATIPKTNVPQHTGMH